LVRETSGALANWRPDPDRWSVAQCLEHVAIVTEAVLPALERAVAGARARGKVADGPFRYGPLARWFLASQAPAPRRGLRTVGRYRPSAAPVDLAAVAARFGKLQVALGAVMEAADGVDLARVQVPSPALPLLRLPVGIWFQALPQHTLRHLEQARRVHDDATRRS